MRPLLAEALGTFALVFCGTGAVVVDELTHGALGTLVIALVFGLVVFAMVQLLAPASGAHLNPAVTIGLSTAGRAEWRNAPPYIAAQLAGALIASALLRWIFPASARLGSTVPAGSIATSFVLEALLTFALMLAILLLPQWRGMRPSLVVGAVVGLEAYFAGPISGASMNPARSIAPAVVSATWDPLWLYCTAPVLGALVATLTLRLVPVVGTRDRS